VFAVRRFWIAFGLLLSWQLPAFAAIGIGVHLSGHHQVDDHGAGQHHGTSDHDEPVKLALELALAASHGHHHELDATPHDHPALRIAVPTASPQQVVALVVAPADPAPAWRSGHVVPCRAAPGTGPPELFYRHCALRL
jgi:hypothetical protein